MLAIRAFLVLPLALICFCASPVNRLGSGPMGACEAGEADSLIVYRNQRLYKVPLKALGHAASGVATGVAGVTGLGLGAGLVFLGCAASSMIHDSDVCEAALKGGFYLTAGATKYTWDSTRPLRRVDYDEAGKAMRESIACYTARDAEGDHEKARYLYRFMRTELWSQLSYGEQTAARNLAEEFALE